MKIRFQSDVDFNQMIVTAMLRREPGVDFQTAQAAKLEGLADRKVLTAAAKAGRVLVTHDRKTLPIHFAKFIAKKRSSGVIVVPQQLSVRLAVEDLLLVWSASETEEWIDQIRVLPL